MADGAYWFDTTAGSFVSSTYYFAGLPGWVKDFDREPPGRPVSRRHLAQPHHDAGPGQALCRRGCQPVRQRTGGAFRGTRPGGRTTRASRCHRRARRQLLLQRLRRPPGGAGFAGGPRDVRAHRPAAGQTLAAVDQAVGAGQRIGGAHRRSRSGAGAGSERAAQNAGRAPAGRRRFESRRGRAGEEVWRWRLDREPRRIRPLSESGPDREEGPGSRGGGPHRGGGGARRAARFPRSTRASNSWTEQCCTTRWAAA